MNETLAYYLGSYMFYKRYLLADPYYKHQYHGYRYNIIQLRKLHNL